MDTNNWRPNQGGSGGGDSSMESVDWRTSLSAEKRQNIVNKITENLKKHVQISGQEKLPELKDCALRFEEKIYTAATNHDDYLRRISLKLMQLENKSANHMPNSLQSNSASNTVNPSDPGMQQVNNQSQPPPNSLPTNHSQASKQILPQIIHNNVPSSGVPAGSGISGSQNSSLQNIQNISVGNNLGHGINSNNFVSQRQISGSQNSQHYLFQQQSHQIAKQKLQQNNINNINNKNTTSMQSHIQQQHQNLLQAAHFQPSQLQPRMLQPSSLSTIKQNQQTHFPQSSQPMSQHHQQLILRQQRQQQQQQQQQQSRIFGQQNNVSNVQSIGQHNNFSVMHQQHLGSQNRQKQQQSLGTQSGNSTMLNNQHSSHLMQSTQSQRAQMELQQQVIPQLQTQSTQFQHQLNMKQRLPTSFNQQRPKAEASSTSSDSTAQTGNPNSVDCQEEMNQKVKAMKDKYLPNLTDIYQRIISRLKLVESLPQQPNSDQVERLKKMKHPVECFMKFLQVPNNNMFPNHKESLNAYEREIVNIINRFNRKSGPTLQQPRMNPLLQSQQTQIPFTQVQTHENSVNLQLQHNNLATLQHNSVSNAQQNMINMLQQQNPNILPHQQLKQLQTRQMQQQLMHKQQLLQNQQFHTQMKHNTKMKLNQVSQLNQRNDGDELKTIEMKPDSLKQIKIEQDNAMNSVNKSRAPLQPANAPFVASSPSTPSVSNLPADTDKVNSCVLLPSNDGNICTPGVSASPLLAECTNQDVNHVNGESNVSGKSTNIDQPLERLLKAVKSISPKSLSDSVKDIGSTLSMMDDIPESPPRYESRTAIGEDLVATIKPTTTGKRKLDHFRNSLFKNVISAENSLNDDSFNHLNYLENSELESTASSTIKMPRIEMKHPLMEEIREINQGLIDTVVVISQENADSAAAPEVGNGTMVSCTYSAVALCPNLKSQYASGHMSPIQPLRLFVPENYPNCSPILLDKLPVEEVSKEYDDLSIKAKWRFSRCVRTLSDPMSLEEMARTWDVCARAVILERVQQSGGGSFTSNYGAWEDCLTAA